MQLQGVDFDNGSESHIIPSQFFDPTAKVLASGGALLVFAWSHIPSPVKKAHVDLSVDSTAFTGQFKDTRASLESRPGFDSAFLEKTSSRIMPSMSSW
jgi:hypothetical protein